MRADDPDHSLKIGGLQKKRLNGYPNIPSPIFATWNCWFGCNELSFLGSQVLDSAIKSRSLFQRYRRESRSFCNVFALA